MKYKRLDGVEFEFEGNPEEITRLYQLVTGELIHTRSLVSQNAETPQKPTITGPSDEDVEMYIKSRPNYQHDIHQVQKHFFGKILSSRGDTTSAYHRTNRQLTAVRKKIETEEKGKFKEEYVKGSLKRYTFEKRRLTLSDLQDR